MPFNAKTYYANKYSKEAWDYLAQARDIRARQKLGTAYDWEERRVDFCVKLARSSMRSSLCYRKMREFEKEARP